MSKVFSPALFGIAISLSISPHIAYGKDLGDLVKDQGYRLYQPLRENWGPGTVFVGKVSGGKLRVDRAICPRIFSTVMPSKSHVALPNYSAVSESDLNLGIGLLDKVVGTGNAANLRMGYKAPRNVSVTWGPLEEHAYFAASAFTPSGQIAEIDAACYAAINDLRRRGKLKSAWVIDRAISTSEMHYTFKRGNESVPSGGSIGGDLKLAGIISLTANAGVSIRDETTLVVNRPLFVAYARPVPLADFVPLATGMDREVGERRVRIKLGSPVSGLEIE